jgi:hypothetical protein
VLCHLAPSTCRSCCEVRRAAGGAGSTPSRNAEFSGSFFDLLPLFRCFPEVWRVAVLAFFSVIFYFWRWLFTLLGGG